MNLKTLSVLLIASCLAIQVSSAATIPAGTTLVLKTTDTISSRDVAGRKFHGKLIQGVGAKGSAVLPVGTNVVGVVQSPRVVVGSITRPLTLKLTQVSVHGQMVPIQTQPFEAHNAGITGPRNVRVSGSAFLLPPGTMLQFRLAHALNM